MDPFVIAMFTGPITAFILFTFIIRKIEGYFDEKSMYLSLMIGIFSGLFFAVAHYVSAISLGKEPTGYLYLVFILTFIIALGMGIVCGLRRFRESKEGAMYGLALGMGIGSMIPVMIGTAYLNMVYTYIAVAVLWFYGLASILVHSSGGFLLGIYIREGRYWYGIGVTALIILPFNFMALWWYLFIFEVSHSMSWEIVVLMVIYALILGYMNLSGLQRGLNPEMRRKWQRDRRKEKKKKFC